MQERPRCFNFSLFVRALRALRVFAVITLCFAMLCLGSASTAMAQSVTGGGAVSFDSGPPLDIAVSARSGPAGILHLSEGNGGFVNANVVELCVADDPDNAAFVVGQITRSSEPDLVGLYFYLAVQDNGNEGDVIFSFTDDEELFPCDFLVPLLPDFLPFGSPLTHGNINVNP